MSPKVKNLENVPKVKNLEGIKGSRFYGRRVGKTLRPEQRERLEHYNEKIGIEVPEKGEKIDPVVLFGDKISDYWLEIGFGGGEHLNYQAAENPTVGIIGCEPFITGVSSLCGHLDAQSENYKAQGQENPNNVRIFMDDARLLMDALPDQSLSKAFILFPDPWPKARHHKRRIISEGNLKVLSRLLKDGTILRIGTDHQDYCRWIMALMLNQSDFTWIDQGAADYHVRPKDWPMTRYEEKAILVGRKSSYLHFQRNVR